MGAASRWLTLIGLCSVAFGQDLRASRVCAGASPCLSPDDQYVAFVRTYVDEDARDYRGNPKTRWGLWVRNLKTGKTRRIAPDGTPVRWIGKNVLLLADGRAIDAGSGNAKRGLASLGAGVRFDNLGWAPDGRDLAFVRVDRNNTGSDLELASGRVLKAKAKPMPRGGGVLAWSPDGKRIAVHLLFFRMGHLPVRQIGVVDVASGNWTFLREEGAYHLGISGFGIAASTRCVWDRRGRYFTFVTGRGEGEADVYVSDGSKSWQVTADGKSKWSPRLDPNGRRVAFLGPGGIAIRNLRTGKTGRVRPPTKPGTGYGLTWSHDGKRILFDWRDDKSVGIYAVSVPPAEPAPEGTPIRTLERPLENRVVSALGADKSSHVEWAVENAHRVAGPRVVAAVRAALKHWSRQAHYDPARDLIDCLQRLGGREGAPEVIGALEHKSKLLHARAIETLIAWRAKDAVPALRQLLKGPERESRAWAAGALAFFGDGTQWKRLARYAADPDHWVRVATVDVLREIRDARGVPLLIDLVEDRKRLYWTTGGRVEVGDQAERALAVLTGKTFHRDRKAWLAWWKKRDGTLPDVPKPNPGLEEIRKRRR